MKPDTNSSSSVGTSPLQRAGVPAERRTLPAGLCGWGACAFLVVAGALSASAGPLNPPAGAVAPTPGPEPRIAINAVNTPGDGGSMIRITQSGSYYLTGNIIGEAGKSGIVIALGDVTLDLNGFAVIGTSGSLTGILVAGDGVSIHNGTIRNWGNDGVNLFSNTSEYCLLSDLRCIANGGNGISASNACVIRNCTSALNQSDGLLIGAGGTITGCTARVNSGRGYSLSSRCVASHCTAEFNDTEGFLVGSGCVISNCAVAGNGSVGIDGSASCSITECTVSSSGGDGIQVSTGSTVQRCNLTSNFGDGIQASDSCLVLQNICIANGNGNGFGAGIHILGSDNRVEGNNCVGADQGIDVDLAGNVIVRNTCSSNITNWSIAVGNVCLVANAQTNGSAINGNSGGVAPGSTDPNANFTY